MKIKQLMIMNNVERIKYVMCIEDEEVYISWKQENTTK